MTIEELFTHVLGEYRKQGKEDALVSDLLNQALHLGVSPETVDEWQQEVQA